MLNLILHPNPILDRLVPEFDFSNPVKDPTELEKDMISLMIEENGIGLAANQVGLESKVFAIKLQNVLDIQDPLVMFNPEVLEVSEEIEYEYEGCLSFPNLFLKVHRPKTILTKFFDKNNKECIIELTGIDARCFLHELDHLNGICFIDRVSRLKLEIATKRQRKLNGRTK
jgi:peptide deformylase